MKTASALKKTALGLAACLLLTGVFALYVQPDFVVQMANQVWACF